MYSAQKRHISSVQIKRRQKSQGHKRARTKGPKLASFPFCEFFAYVETFSRFCSRQDEPSSRSPGCSYFEFEFVIFVNGEQTTVKIINSENIKQVSRGNFVCRENFISPKCKTGPSREWNLCIQNTQL